MRLKLSSFKKVDDIYDQSDNHLKKQKVIEGESSNIVMAWVGIATKIET